MQFEWDEEKRKSNFDKHGIDFEIAVKVFFVEHISYRSDHQKEVRYLATGKVLDIIISIVYTIRGEKIRIISARKASRNERKKYRAVFEE